MWPENELYEKWRNAERDERVELEKQLYCAFKRCAGWVVFTKVGTGDPGLADEIAGDALRALPTFEGRSQLSTWVYSIATRRCNGALRQIVPRRRIIDAREFDEEHYPREGADPTTRIALNEITESLTDEENRLLKLMWERRDQNEIARELGITPNAADLRRRRLRRKLKKFLGQ